MRRDRMGVEVRQGVEIRALNDDLRLVKGDVAVLVTAVLPKGVENFALVNGIWVTSKQIHRMIANTAGMYGDLQGIIGASLQAIPALTEGEEDVLEETAPALGTSVKPNNDDEEVDPDNVPR